NARMPNKRRLDLARLDAKAPQLHLRVRPPHKLQHPVRTPARQIPAAVHPSARSPIRVRNKPLRRQTSPPQIATRKPSSRDVKLPANPDRHRLQTRVEDIGAIVGQRPADRELRAALLAFDRKADGVDRGLGRAIEIGETSNVEMPRNLVLQFDRDDLAAEDQMTQ